MEEWPIYHWATPLGGVERKCTKLKIYTLPSSVSSYI